MQNEGQTIQENLYQFLITIVLNIINKAFEEKLENHPKSFCHSPKSYNSEDRDREEIGDL